MNMVLADSQHAGHLEDNKNTEFSALEAQFFEYNQIPDSFGSFGSYDVLHHQPSNEFGLSLDLMNLPPPAYHLSNGGEMDTSPLYTPMEAMSINPSMTTMSPSMASHSSMHHSGIQAQGVPLPPSPTGSTSSMPHHHMHYSHHGHSQSQSQSMHSPMMTSPHMLVSGNELSTGAISSAASSAGGSPISHRDGLPDAPSPSPSMTGGQKDPSHGRTSSNTSDKNQTRYNPLKATRGSPGASSAASTTTGPRTRRRAGTTGSAIVKKEKEEMRAAAAAAALAKDEDHDSDDDDLDYPAPGNANKSDKREEIRKQRIESEQRRRDELREGYRRLKEALPSSNQKSSKVALLDRAVNHVRYMEMTRTQLQVRLNAAEMEMARLRQVNEALMLGTAEQRAAAAAASAAVQAHVQPQY